MSAVCVAPSAPRRAAERNDEASAYESAYESADELACESAYELAHESACESACELACEAWGRRQHIVLHVCPHDGLDVYIPLDAKRKLPRVDE